MSASVESLPRPGSAPHEHGAFERWLRQRLFDRLGALQGELVIEDALGQTRLGEDAVASSDPLSVRIRVHDPAFYWKVAAQGSVGAGEAYMDGAWDCDDLVALVRLLMRNRGLLDAMEGGGARLGGLALKALHALRRNTRAGSRRNIAAHYDLGNALFRLFLDTTTISKEQHALARERIARAGLGDRVTVLLEDYRDLSGRYDRLVSIEMIEAIGHQYLRTYLGKCSSLLKDDGLTLIQAITIEDHRYARALRTVDFIKRFVFPGSFIPSVSAILDAMARATDLRLIGRDESAYGVAAALAFVLATLAFGGRRQADLRLLAVALPLLYACARRFDHAPAAREALA